MAMCILVGMLAVNRTSKRKGAGPRDPERTRKQLLKAAFDEIHLSGFRSADMDAILGQAGVTKGALYHHFESKEALGYAVVDEIIADMTHDRWLHPLRNATNPLDTLVGIVQATSMKPQDCQRGCPLNNLAQEMSPIDEGFRIRTAKLFKHWRHAIARALRTGQKQGAVRTNVDPNEAATFFIAAYEGYFSLAKNSQDARVLRSGLKNLIAFLEGLRAS
jgi:TetR/AcrR family transcriptional repressor of nem operon